MELDFVDYVLLRFGLGDIWHGWIRESFSVLANMSCFKLFKAFRVLQKEDPLSPFLYMMVVEALSDLLMKAREVGMIGDS